MGPKTLGYERWANLPPSEIELQSFGSASVSETGVLDIKLMGINGDLRMQKTLEPVLVEAASDESKESGAASDESKESGAASIVFNTFASLVALVGMVL